MNKVLACLVLLMVVLLIGCAQFTITGSGNVVTQEETISDFDSVDISSMFRVKISQGENFRVSVRVDENLVEHLDVSKQGSKLILRLKPNRSYNILNATMEAEVTMPVLHRVDLSGSSEAEINGFASSESLEIDLSGMSELSGDFQAGDTRMDTSGGSTIRITGSGGNLSIDASGSSEVDLTDFPGADATISASGSSTVTVNLSGRLTADASGSSDIYYLGDPVLGSVDTSGSSTIRPK